MSYKYPKARKLLADLAVTHFTGEVQHLLTAGMEFLECGDGKIEGEHPMPCLDWLFAVLEECRSTSFDITASSEEDAAEEIDLTTYIKARLIALSLESSGAVPIRACQGVGFGYGNTKCTTGSHY